MYTQTPHVGCQPGEIEKDGTCEVAVSGGNARIFGSEDRVVPVESVREFDRVLGDLGVEREIHVSEGASHAFANPSGQSFHPDATRDVWSKTLDFLDEHLRE